MVFQKQEILIMRQIVSAALIFSLNIASVWAGELNKGLFSIGEPPAEIDGYAEYFLSLGFPEDGFTYLAYGDQKYFSLNRDIVLIDSFVQRDKPDNFIFTYDVTHRWPITRLNSEYIPTEIIKRYEDFHYDYPTEYAAKYVRGLGCFQDTPLRFGDINNDGTDEVVLFLANDIVLFSPDKERIVFSEQLSIDDWLSLEDTAEEPENKSLPAPPSYQYLSSMLMDAREYQPGYRGYSKLYFGDFDEDGNADILVWRKFYESYEQGSKTKGFKKLHDNFQHYERQSGADSSGEFNVQLTDVADIQQWLTASQLTWSKGYPSKSECAGKEGQLIPEMHDPLLNDPDVLK